MIFSLPNCEHLMKKLEKKGHVRGKMKMERFADGEIYMQILDNVDGKQVTVLGNILAGEEMEMFLLLDALSRWGAHVTLIIPYFGYARQDRICAKGEALSLQVVCSILSLYPLRHTFVVDCHTEHIHDYMDAEDVTALPILADEVRNMVEPCVIAPDQIAPFRAKFIAEEIGGQWSYVTKQRKGLHNIVVSAKVHKQLKGKTLILVDDMIDTGRTMLKALDSIKGRWDKKIIMATHCLFNGKDSQKLKKMGTVIVTDTRDHKENKVKTVSIVPIIEKILREHIREKLK